MNQRLKDRQFPVFAYFFLRAPNLEHLSLKCDVGLLPEYDRLYARVSSCDIKCFNSHRMHTNEQARAQIPGMFV